MTTTLVRSKDKGLPKFIQFIKTHIPVVFPRLSTQSDRNLPPLPPWEWDLNMVGAAFRAVQASPLKRVWDRKSHRLIKKFRLSSVSNSLAHFMGRCEIFLNGVRNGRSSWVHFNSNFSYIPSVKLTSKGEHY